MKDRKGTSTFIIHHDRCDPRKWTAADIIAFANFVETGSIIAAAALARRGMQMVTSEHLVPAGGTLEPIGWCQPDEFPDCASELSEIASDDDVTPVCRLYRGPVEYCARFAIGDSCGNFDGWEYEIKPSREEAEAYFAEEKDREP